MVVGIGYLWVSWMSDMQRREAGDKSPESGESELSLKNALKKATILTLVLRGCLPNPWKSVEMRWNLDAKRPRSKHHQSRRESPASSAWGEKERKSALLFLPL